MKKIFELDPSWSLYQLIYTLALGDSPFLLGLFLLVETLVEYLALRFKWKKTKASMLLAYHIYYLHDRGSISLLLYLE